MSKDPHYGYKHRPDPPPVTIPSGPDPTKDDWRRDSRLGSAGRIDKITAGLLQSEDETFTIDLDERLLSVFDDQDSPVERVVIGRLGEGDADYGLEVYDAAGKLMLGASGLGVDIVGTEQIEDGAVEEEKIAANAVTTDKVGDEAISAAKVALGLLDGSQNLLWEDAGPEHERTKASPTGGVAWYYHHGEGGTTGTPLEPLSTFGLEVGDVVSFSVEIKQDSGSLTGRAYVEWLDGSSSRVRLDTASFIGPADFERSVLEDLEVPAGAETMRVAADADNNNTGTILARRAMLVRGPIALPFDEPPFRLNRDLIVDGDVFADNVIVERVIADDQILTRHIVANAVTASEIAAGAITAAKISAGAVTAQKLSVGVQRGTGLVNGGFETGDSEGWAGSTGTVTNAGSDAHSGSYVMDVPNGSGGPNQFSEDLPVQEGERILVSAWARPNPSDAPSANQRLAVRWADASGATIGQNTLDTASRTNPDWQYLRGSRNAPTGAVTFRVDLGEGTGSGSFWWDDVQVVYLTRAVDIEDGTITADHLDVSTLSAISADIGEVTAGQMRNSGNTAGIRFSGSLPGTWDSYVDFLATGSEPFLKHGLLELPANATAVEKKLRLPWATFMPVDDLQQWRHFTFYVQPRSTTAAVTLRAPLWLPTGVTVTAIRMRSWAATSASTICRFRRADESGATTIETLTHSPLGSGWQTISASVNETLDEDRAYHFELEMDPNSAATDCRLQFVEVDYSMPNYALTI